ncbi:MAG TPA: hypothetical protein VGC61_04955, partial [Pyrinomonadaceae bacterium]
MRLIFLEKVAAIVLSLLLAVLLVQSKGRFGERFGFRRLATNSDERWELFLSSKPTNNLALNGASLNSVESTEDLVVYPNPKVAFICGPQLKSGSRLNPAPWFDRTARSSGITLGERNPRVAPI